MKDKEKLSEILKGDRARKIIIFLGLAGIALIFFSTLFSLDSSPKEEESADTLFSVEEYCNTMQENLEQTLEKIEGVGNASVLLTIENSVECVYLENNTTKTKEIEPVIRGVVVVCQGGGSPVVVERVTSAVTRALNISTAKVCVTKSSNQQEATK